MRIFILPTSYPDAEHPQKDIFIYEQAKELARRGHEIVVLHVKKLSSKKILSRCDKNVEAFDDGFAKRYLIHQKTFMEGKFHGWNRDGFVKSMEYLYSYAERIHGKPDVIYAHFSIWAGYAASAIAENNNVPLVTIEHFSGLMEPTLSSDIKKGLTVVINKSDYFLCVSDGLKKAVVSHIQPGKELLVVSDMVDRSFIYKPLVPQEKFVICSIGNLNKRKDFATVIQAFIKVFPVDANVELRIGGDGPEKDNLKKIVNDNSREGQILFLGRLTREQTIEEYTKCNMFALASQFETFGLVYREALATGRPIVTADHGGFSQYDWHNEYGYKVPVRDVDSFAEAMFAIYENYGKYNLQRISELCLNDCSAERVGEQIESILYSAITK
ncbi:MAG: glycosyltransferase [Lachnospira sp.]